jgi:cell division septation protein DedD
LTSHTSKLLVRNVLFVGALLLSLVHAETLERVEDLLKAGETAAARRALAATDYASSDSRARYLAGLLSRDSGEARQHFQVASRDVGSKYADDALLELAESAYGNPMGLYLTARKVYLALIESFPNSPHIPLALYRIGRTYQITAGAAGTQTAQMDSARARYREVIERFPSTPPADVASVALVQIHEQVSDRSALGRDKKLLPREVVGRHAESPRVSTSTDVQFWVQVGAFAKQSSVDALLNRLKAHRHPVSLRGNGQLSVVRVGPFETREQAERTSRFLTQVESLKCSILEE